MSPLQGFIAELGITVTDLEVWQSIALSLVLGFGCLVLGVWLTRAIGLLRTNAPAGETLGVGLSAGLMLLTAWSAAIGSGGRSSFTPVAIAFTIAFALAVLGRVRRPQRDAAASSTTTGSATTSPVGPTDRRRLILVLVGGGCFVAAAALVYGATIAPSPRDGMQPVEFKDVAFYAVLGRNLATTGLETTLSASGFSDIPGLPNQGWYHWGELWLAGAVIRLFGVSAMAARYFVVLPVLLLAAAALSGTIVRRWTGADSSRVFLFGFLACLFLAPVGLIPGPFFASWATGMLFGITLFGMGAVAVLFCLYCIAALRGREITWPGATFVGSAAAFILPAHIAVALLALVGIGSVVAVRMATWLVGQRQGLVSRDSGRILAVASIVILATVIWGTVTGHAFGDGGVQPIVTPFNDTWRDSVAITTLGAGALLAIAIALPFAWRTHPAEAELYLGTLILLIVGAVGWGARLGDFTMFYLFFAGIAVIATPVAAIACRRLWERFSASDNRALALGLVVLCVLQLEAGLPNAGLRLQFFGGGDQMIPKTVMDRVRQLPPDAKLAYTCQPLSESGWAVPRLLSIDAHTGRAVVPMCFEAETLSTLNGAPQSSQVQNLAFLWAPQRILYPNAEAAPSSDEVADFLDTYDIHYIYADAGHPNVLVPDAIPIAQVDDFQILRIP